MVPRQVDDSRHRVSSWLRTKRTVPIPYFASRGFLLSPLQQTGNRSRQIFVPAAVPLEELSRFHVFPQEICNGLGQLVFHLVAIHQAALGARENHAAEHIPF